MPVDTKFSPHTKLLASPPIVVRFMPRAVPLQTVAEDADIAGNGLTVTVTSDDEPAHPPTVDVGVTLYVKVPKVLLLGLVKGSVIVVPLPAVPPDILPALSTVHVKLLGVLGFSGNERPLPLHTDVPPLCRTGDGLTFTVTIDDMPRQEPVEEVGVTEYSTLATAELLVSVNVWMKLLPPPPDAPRVVPGSITVQAKLLPVVLAVDAVSGILTELQVVAISVDVITGVGYTLTVTVVGVAAVQEPMLAGEVGSTVYVAVPMFVWLVLDRMSVIVVVPLVPPEIPDDSDVTPHVNVLPVIVAASPIFMAIPLQIACDVGVLTPGNGLTVTVISDEAPVQPTEPEEVGVTL